ncbi:hypothetical protein [Marinobacter fonticola]|uniref:hypothetical protein n=1 Tax=Marinobacter fonticola TaxID=2603215 RepID=UPI0011E89AB1|nr:hypothetical protein [Marinobacter fonticola]
MDTRCALGDDVAAAIGLGISSGVSQTEFILIDTAWLPSKINIEPKAMVHWVIWLTKDKVELTGRNHS